VEKPALILKGEMFDNPQTHDLINRIIWIWEIENVIVNNVEVDIKLVDINVSLSDVRTTSNV
jgi:hypothetical protein